MEFSHIGVITDEPKDGEVFVEATRVWVTEFLTHPYRVEWLRFEPDSPVTGPVRTRPHVAYRVDSIEEAARGLKVLLEPFYPLCKIFSHGVSPLTQDALAYWSTWGRGDPVLASVPAASSSMILASRLTNSSTSIITPSRYPTARFR